MSANNNKESNTLVKKYSASNLVGSPNGTGRSTTANTNLPPVTPNGTDRSTTANTNLPPVTLNGTSEIQRLRQIQANQTINQIIQ
jgi:hypothetical protein